jgi:hypothetical protein
MLVLVVIGLARFDGTGKQESPAAGPIVRSADSSGRESSRTSTSSTADVEEAVANKVLSPALPAPARHAVMPRRASATVEFALSFDSAPSLQTIGTRIQV